MALLNKKAWLLAARPPTLWAAIAPVLVGAGLAAADDVFHAGALLGAMVGAIAIQVGVNFANDVADAASGADNADRIGPTRAVASGLISPSAMWKGVWIAFALAGAAGIYLTWLAGWVVIAIGVASVAAALGYTSGPIPYGYRGFGEVFVFAFFGVTATVGSRYVHDSTAPLDAWLLSIPIGLLAVAILVANNIRDIDSDRTSGKRTLAVMLGRPRTRLLFGATVFLPFIAIGTYAVADLVPRWTAIALIAVPLAIPPAKVVGSTDQGPALISALKGTARLHITVGALLALGAWITSL